MTRLIVLALLVAVGFVRGGEMSIISRNDEAIVTLPRDPSTITSKRPACLVILNTGAGNGTILGAVASPLVLPQGAEMDFEYREGGWHLHCSPEKGVPTS